SYGLYRLVRHRPDRTFYQVVLLGLLARMGTALAIVALVLALVPVHFFAFIGALFVTTAVGLTIEVALVHRGGPATPPPASFEQPHPSTPL
ncbi:MAG: hypothetical protein R3362_01105, partial [Rhodothermales bacterium]|nr:hypothetical protein [Rhodothermales bacterium]